MVNVCHARTCKCIFYCIEQLVQAIKIAQNCVLLWILQRFIAASVSDATPCFMKGYAVKLATNVQHENHFDCYTTTNLMILSNFFWIEVREGRSGGEGGGGGMLWCDIVWRQWDFRWLWQLIIWEKGGMREGEREGEREGGREGGEGREGGRGKKSCFSKQRQTISFYSWATVQ